MASGVTRGLSQGGANFAEGAREPLFGYAIISSQKLTYVTYIWAYIFVCSRHIYMVVNLRADPVRGESHIQ